MSPLEQLQIFPQHVNNDLLDELPREIVLWYHYMTPLERLAVIEIVKKDHPKKGITQTFRLCLAHIRDNLEQYDPCGGRSCDECEIGGCDHGREVV